jgi:lipoprotein-anchoring transpeptidase ErfK/SrfK
MLRIIGVLAGTLALSLTSPAVAERTITVNFSTATLTISDDDEVIFETKVVLPKSDYYTVPVSGVVERGISGPTWTPTANMHRDFPGRFKEHYGPYEKGNAMGHCKITINYGEAEQRESILQYVHIHGNAKDIDLGKRLSRSCVRVPDSFCASLLSAINTASGPVAVKFVR